MTVDGLQWNAFYAEKIVLYKAIVKFYYESSKKL